RRIPTPHGFEFRKDSHVVSEYPDKFEIFVEPIFMESSTTDVPQTKLPPEKTPTRVILRWIDPETGALLESSELPLEKIVEPWPENRTPQVWYRAEVAGLKKPLTAQLEIQVLGKSE